MAAPWGAIGSWAAEAEREESERAYAEPQSFPSLKESMTSKQKKKKMSLTEFYSTSTGHVSSKIESKGLTHDEMLRLPTGPKERSAEEMQYGRLGGGFSSYGRSGPMPGRFRDRDDTEGSRRQFGGFDDDRRGTSNKSFDFDHVSRADEVDNWATVKKPIPLSDGRRSNRSSSLGGALEGDSRADGVDNWGATKKQLYGKASRFGSEFSDSAQEPDRWARGGNVEAQRERPRLVLDPPKGGVRETEPRRTDKPSPFGAARPREEVLAEKGVDWKKVETELETKKSNAPSSRPTSSHSSRPSSAQSMRSEGLENVGLKPKSKMNPFGDARPRELLLEERGQDWRKIDLDLEHRGISRLETEGEKFLKEELNILKVELKKEICIRANLESQHEVGKDQQSLQDIISRKERELEELIHDLDDKVRFGQKAVERPGSGSGRHMSFSEWSSSPPGSSDKSRSMEFMERPRSRGAQDIWTRPSDYRSMFASDHPERGYIDGSDFGRPRGRW